MAYYKYNDINIIKESELDEWIEFAKKEFQKMGANHQKSVYNAHIKAGYERGEYSEEKGNLNLEELAYGLKKELVPKIRSLYKHYTYEDSDYFFGYLSQLCYYFNMNLCDEVGELKPVTSMSVFESKKFSNRYNIYKSILQEIGESTKYYAGVSTLISNRLNINLMKCKSKDREMFDKVDEWNSLSKDEKNNFIDKLLYDGLVGYFTEINEKYKVLNKSQVEYLLEAICYEWMNMKANDDSTRLSKINYLIDELKENIE